MTGPAGTPRPAELSPIVVGVSAVTGSRAALQWAAAEARLRGARVRAVMAWSASGLPGGAPGRAPAQSITSPEQRSSERLLAEYVAEALGEDHGVELKAVEGKTKTVLVAETEEAALLVLDSPATAKLYEVGGKRTAPKIIFASACPVVVMPPLDPGADADLDAFGTGADAGEPQPATGAPATP